jgi:hypothetical protein
MFSELAESAAVSARGWSPKQRGRGRASGTNSKRKSSSVQICDPEKCFRRSWGGRRLCPAAAELSLMTSRRPRPVPAGRRLGLAGWGKGWCERCVASLSRQKHGRAERRPRAATAETQPRTSKPAAPAAQPAHTPGRGGAGASRTTAAGLMHGLISATSILPSLPGNCSPASSTSF